MRIARDGSLQKQTGEQNNAVLPPKSKNVPASKGSRHNAKTCRRISNNEKSNDVESCGNISDSHDHHQNMTIYNYASHTHTHLLLLLIDGVALALIAACTISEAASTWNHFLQDHMQINLVSLSFWIAGCSCQVMGLLFLIGHVISNEISANMERGGMFLLTIGPIFNMVAASLFQCIGNLDPLLHFNKAWLMSEFTELIGIILLDISCYDFLPNRKFMVLIIELAGYSIVALAAILEFDFSHSEADIDPEQHQSFSTILSTSLHYIFVLISPRLAQSFAPLSYIYIRSGYVHWTDVFALFLLGVIAIMDYW